MVISYIRPDKHFYGAFEQLKLINSYAEQNGLQVGNEFIDQTSQSRRISERTEVVEYLRSYKDSDLLISDIWVLSSNIEDLTQMCTCLLKNNMRIHVINASVIIDRNSDVMLVLGIIDQLRQVLENKEKKVIGRPKGSRSSSKFDKYLDAIIHYLREDKSVSEMARVLKVSRSSLKDYIESRELKEVAKGTMVLESPENAEEKVISTIKCPLADKTEMEELQ
jgi:DNA invertase Pin-like site-specific DNA recombinase